MKCYNIWYGSKIFHVIVLFSWYLNVEIMLIACCEILHVDIAGKGELK